jgi:hypothetical protein
MRRIAALGFALIGATVLIAVSAAGASAAEPAFYECKKLTKNTEGKYEGGFTNKACSEASGTHEGKYELKEGIGTKPTIKGKSGHAELESSAGNVSCTSSKSIGQLQTPTHIGEIHVAYKGCTSGGKKCNSTGAKAGTIETRELQGDLGYLSKAAHEAGVLITPVGGGNLAEFNCEGLEISTKGGVIGQATPVNEFTKLGELTFEKSGAATQKFRKFEGETATHELETTIGPVGPVSSSQEQTNVQKGGFLEIKA